MSKIKQELHGVGIADTSIRQPVFITMVMLLIVVIGFLSFTRLPVNLYPDFSVPVVAVRVMYPGASPDSVADQVSKPIEDALISLSGIKTITSQSNEGIAVITAEFQTEIDVDTAEQDVRSKVKAIRPQLPAEIEEPIFEKFDPDQVPVVTLSIFSAGQRNPVELRKVVEDEIVPLIQRIPGVGSVPINGGQTRQINVLLDLERMQARQILPALVNRSIQNANINLGLGSINAGDVEISLRTPSMFDTPQDIGEIQITGTRYRIKDIATIQDGIKEVDTYSRLNGEEAVGISIIKRSDANVVEVAEEVRAELEEIFAEYPDLEYHIARDSSEFVEESTHSAIEELFVASISAMIVVFFFFRNIRNTLVTIIGLPIIMIGTFAAISLFGLTINVITLMALSLSVGLVIDDAIVVRENIFRHTEMGEPPVRASSNGTAEVATSVVAMTLTLIAVFVPVTFTTGITGVIFKSFGITTAAAMALSLFEAFTLAPMTSAHLFGGKKKEKDKKKGKGKGKKDAHEDGQHDQTRATAENESSTGKEDTEDTEDTEKDTHNAKPTHAEEHEDIGFMGRVYGKLLGWSLRHRLIVIILAVGVLIASFQVATGLKFAFFPDSDEGEFYVGFELQPGAPLEQTNELSLQAEQIIMQDPQVELVQATVGGSGSPERGEVFVKLIEEHEPTAVVRERLRPQLEFLPTLAFGMSGYGGNSSQVTGRDIQLQIQTNGELEELVPLLLTFRERASQVEGLVDIDTTYKPGKPELEIKVDPTKVGDLGITNDDIASSVRTLINGSNVAVFRKDGEDTDIMVRLQPGDRANIEDIKDINVPTPNGSIPLRSLVDIELTVGPTTIRRQDRVKQVVVGANVVGRNTNEVIQEIRAGLEGIELPKGVDISFGGSAEDQAEGFQTLLIAMGLSILFVYMVLASQFGSFLQPLVIMLAMPFSFLGAFLALRIAGMSLDIISMIGLIMLMGLVVKNSILLIDFTNTLRDNGLDKHTALEKAGSIRLRPILMTSIAIMAGAVPVAIGLGEGSEIRRGLSIALIGGMLTSTILTLLVVPTAYSILDGIINLWQRIIHWRPGRKRDSHDMHVQREAKSDTI